MNAFNKHIPTAWGLFIPLLIMCAFLGIIMVISALFQGGIMSFFGFDYETIPSFFLFFIASYIVGIPIELVAQSLPRAMSILGSVKLHGVGYFAIMIGIEVLGYSVILCIADLLMSTISATGIAIVAASVGLAVIDAWMDYRLPDAFNTEDILKDLPF